jgi:type II secretory ATPase GspE/PulE/Tfp pilus assembly ATPase PilB-like protein
MLEDLDPLRLKVQTIESHFLRPVAHWRQSRVSDRRDRTNGPAWERALGGALRRGAEAILVEKIAQVGVAQLAIQAAQVGHLVLSTMAIGRACSAVAELRRLQVTTHQLIDGLSLVIGQRLIGRLCSDCSLPDDREAVRQALAGALNTWLNGYAVQARRAAPTGCTRCGQSGTVGRVLVYELLDIDARARALIASTCDPVELEHGLLTDGRSMWDCGLRRVAEGAISFDALKAAIRQPH